MSDISFHELAQQLPSNAIVASGDTVLIDLKRLMGESAVATPDRKVGEALSKLLVAAAKTQDVYNQTAAQPLNSYFHPSYGIPTQTEGGGLYAIRTHYLTVQLPLNLSEITGVTF